MVRDLNNPLSIIDRFSRQKVSKYIVEVNSIISQLNLKDIYRILHYQQHDYTFFSRSHGIFTKTDPILGNKTHLNKFKRIEITYLLELNYKSIIER